MPATPARKNKLRSGAGLRYSLLCQSVPQKRPAHNGVNNKARHRKTKTRTATR